MSKVKNINGWDQAEDAMRQMVEIDLEERALRAAADERIKGVREDLSADLAGPTAARQEIEAALERFCREHKDEMAPLKSKDLRHGRIGFRDLPRFSWPRKVELLITRLRELKLTDYIRVKEEPDKAGIMAHFEKLPLKDLGVKRTVEQDAFYVDLKNES
jgi:phage host-nuclease inhibitor protein Gam